MFISRGLILIDFGNMFFLNLQAFGSCSTSASAPPSPDSDLGRGTKSLAQMSRSLTYLEHCCAHQSESFCVPQLKHICCKSYIFTELILAHTNLFSCTKPPPEFPCQRHSTHFFATLSALRWDGTERGATWNDYASGVFPIFSLGLQDTYQVWEPTPEYHKKLIFLFLFDGFHPL